LIDRYKCRRIHVIADYPLFSSRQRIEGFKKAIATAGVHGPIYNAEERNGRVAAFQWAFRKTRELLTQEIAQDMDEMASRAVSLMLRLIDELPEARADYIPVQLWTAEDRLAERTP
jgi:DNA-binding LacI/PurR family transcriptional regulator